MSATVETAFKLCVEYGKINETPGLADVVVASANETVVFPYVDSCIAVIFMLSDDTAVCGHASAEMMGKIDRKMMLGDITDRMLEEIPKNIEVVRRIFVGASDWKGPCEDHVEAATAKKLNSNDTHFNDAGPLNIFLKLGPREVTVCAASGKSSGARPQEGTAIKTFKLT
jgi:hypothetical protein